MKSKIKNPYMLVFIITWLTVVSYFLMIGVPFSHKITGLMVDLSGQYMDFFRSITLFFKDPSSILYSFSNGMGGDNLGLWAYYLFSPLNIIFALVPTSILPFTLILLTPFKLAFASVSMLLLLNKTKLTKNYEGVPFALSYGLSTWIVSNNMNTIWIDAVALMPILILSLEHLLIKKRIVPFAIIYAISLILNYYMTYMITIFLVMYVFWRVFNKHTALNNIKRKWHAIWLFSLSGIISAGTTAILILPTIYQLSLGKATHNTGISFGFKFNILDLIPKLLPGSMTIKEIQDYGHANIYVPFLILILLFVFFVNKRISKSIKLSTGLIFGWLLLATSWTPGILIMHAMQNPVWYNARFTFVTVFFAIFIAAYALKEANVFDNNTYDKKITIFTYIIISIIAVYTIAANILVKNPPAFVNGIPVLIIMAVLTLKYIKNNNKQGAYLVTIVTLILNSAMVLATIPSVSYSDYNNPKSTNDIVSSVIKKDNSKDNNLPTNVFRISKNYERTDNDGIFNQFSDASFFSSTLNKNTEEMYATFGQESSKNSVRYVTGNYLLDGIFNVKYVATVPKNTIKNWHIKSNAKENSTLLLPTRYDSENFYQKVYSNKVDIYKNPYALGFANAVSQNSLNNKFTKNSLFNQEQMLNSRTGLSDKIFNDNQIDDEKYIYKNAKVSYLKTGIKLTKIDHKKPIEIYYNFKPQNNDSYYLRYYLNPDNKANYNSKSTESLIVKSQGVALKYNPKKLKERTLRAAYNDKGKKISVKILALSNKNSSNSIVFKPEDLKVYSLSTDYVTKSLNLLKKHSFKITSFKNTRISGYITTTKQYPVIASEIQYVPGWHVKVDGKEVASQKVNHYFVGAKAQPGNHYVTFYYQEPFLKEGAIISATFILILVTIFIKERKKIG